MQQHLDRDQRPPLFFDKDSDMDLTFVLMFALALMGWGEALFQYLRVRRLRTEIKGLTKMVDNVVARLGFAVENRDA